MHDFSNEHPVIDRPPENHIQLMIGKVASLYGITVQTLRHYDKIGLFRPEVINPDTGYRYYSLEQLRHLEYILFLRRLQFSLPEIQEAMVQFRAGKELEDVLRLRDQQLKTQMDEIQKLRDTIGALLSMRDARQMPLNQLRIEWLSPPRQLLLRSIPPLSVSAPDFGLHLMEYRKELLGTLPPIQTSYSFGAAVSMKDFRSSGTLQYTDVLLDPGPYGIAHSPENAQQFPEGFYAVIRFSRSQLRPEDAYQRLCRFIEQHRFYSDDKILEMAPEPSFSSISRISDIVELQVHVALEDIDSANT